MEPVEVADAATEFEAEILAEHLRSEGMVAHVVPPDLLLSAGLGRWRVMVERSEAEHAAASLLAQRRKHAGAPALRECPACGYALEGLDRPARCPECGLMLDPEREAELARGLRGADRGLALSYTRARPWLWLAAAVCVCGGVVAGELMPRYLVTAYAWPGVLVMVVVAVLWLKRTGAKPARGGDHGGS
jgi:hypothetical protein